LITEPADKKRTRVAGNIAIPKSQIEPADFAQIGQLLPMAERFSGDIGAFSSNGHIIPIGIEV
jgi:hypothetical protein